MSVGVYLLEVLSVHHVFSQVKIKVDDESKITVVEFKYPGGTDNTLFYDEISIYHLNLF